MRIRVKPSVQFSWQLSIQQGPNWIDGHRPRHDEREYYFCFKSLVTTNATGNNFAPANREKW